MSQKVATKVLIEAANIPPLMASASTGLSPGGAAISLGTTHFLYSVDSQAPTASIVALGNATGILLTFNCGFNGLLETALQGLANASAGAPLQATQATVPLNCSENVQPVLIVTPVSVTSPTGLLCSFPSVTGKAKDSFSNLFFNGPFLTPGLQYTAFTAVASMFVYNVSGGPITATITLTLAASLYVAQII